LEGVRLLFIEDGRASGRSDVAAIKSQAADNTYVISPNNIVVLKMRSLKSPDIGRKPKP
jgi:hypothetical protein